MTKKTVKTIEDIARLAKVSKSTVSRSLNDSPLVKKETKERIQAIAREHDFRFNAPARNLSMSQSYTIAFVTHAYHAKSFSMEDLFSLEIMGGITSGLHTLGYELLVVHVDPRDAEWAHKYLDSGRVDGFILMTSNRKRWHIKTLVEMDAPFIVWGAPARNLRYCSVTGDDIEGGRLATEYLIGIGRQRIAFLGGHVSETEVQHRFKGYETALQAAGRAVDPDLLAYGDYSHASGTTAMAQLLEQSPDLDAVFVNSDLMAVAAINVIQNSGQSVPEDVAVVGYDDLSIASYNSLPLTTIRQNIPLAGKMLAENLVQYIETGVVTNVTLPVELVVRKSA
jgi:DNA-binding LacI/PurR family transcriptional regulator